ncbi:MAG TPA: winged helix DNA-binding domain-containing protein [bacterium]|nr:winged helix DNA-binding domain-containing protein [bacterium]
MLAHLRLLPPRKLRAEQGVLDFVRHVNCIQYDPINIVGQNTDLVLQSRVHGYKPAMLTALLYKERKLLDGVDKQMSIYPVEDWPYFATYREDLGDNYARRESTAKAAKLLDWVRDEIRRRGPLSSTDLEDDTRIDWWLANKARAVRIAMNILLVGGETVVHHRVGTRRYFELSRRVLPPKLHNVRKGHASQEDYLEWHVFRRSGGVGLVHPKVNAKWGGIIGWRGGQIRGALARLLKKGRLVRMAIEGLPRQEFYIRRGDLPALETAGRSSKASFGAAFIAPLDNLMWDSDLIEMLFDFVYTWEVYKPASRRTWGYYVLPVLVGDRLVARFDPIFDKKAKLFTIQNWWWEKGIDRKDEELLAALQDCLQQFRRYLGADSLKLGEKPKRDFVLKEMVAAI